MKNTLAGLAKPAAILTFVLATLTAANADEVRFIGTTMGRFDLQSFANANTFLDLAYSSSNFDNTTDDGFLGLGGNPSPGTNFNNLGSFSLGITKHSYSGHTFDLEVTFTAPVTIDGGDTTQFHANLVGSVTDIRHGGVFIDFDNTPQFFTFSNSTASGAFSFSVNDLSIAPGQVASVTGTILGSQQPVPEPASVALVLIGLAGVVRLHRRTA